VQRLKIKIGFSSGDRVYFYKPPTQHQHEIARLGRRAKHLPHYHGPTPVQRKADDECDRQYHIEYDRKDFKRDISMLIPEKMIQTIDVNRHDPTAETSSV
jgi:hypothetical protein